MAKPERWESDDEVAEALTRAGLPAVPCGLNADWSGRAWEVGPCGVSDRPGSLARPNTVDGQVFLLDSEEALPDGRNGFAVVRRFRWPEDEEGGEVVQLSNEGAKHPAADMPLAEAVELAKWTCFKLQNNVLPIPEDPEDAVRHLVRRVGEGFHPDTPAAEYVRDDLTPSFTPEEARSIDASLARAFAALGERVYEVGLDEMDHLWSEGQEERDDG